MEKCSSFITILPCFALLQACSGDVTGNFPSKTTSETGLAIREDLIDISEPVIIGSAEVIPDLAVQPHTLQQEFALINVNIPNVIVEQVKREFFLKFHCLLDIVFVTGADLFHSRENQPGRSIVKNRIEHMYVINV